MLAFALALMLEATAAGGAPVDLSARTFRVDEGRCVFVWRGEARLHTSKGILEADQMEGYAAREAGGCGPLQRVEAQGNVVLTTRNRSRSASHFAVYDVGTQGFLLTEPKPLGPPERAARPRDH